MFVMAFARHFTCSHKINCSFIETYESGSGKNINAVENFNEIKITLSFRC